MKKIFYSIAALSIFSSTVAYACYIKDEVSLGDGRYSGKCSNTGEYIHCHYGVDFWYCTAGNNTKMGSSKQEAASKACGCG